MTFPLELSAIRVSQPLGEFYVVALPARTLQKTTYIDPTRVSHVDRKRFFYRLLGAQRLSSIPRAKQIAHYIDTVEAAFPNSIILAANYVNNGVLQEDPETRWRIQVNENGCHKLVIPTDKPMASVVDGQHRLLGYLFCREERKDMELLCAIYMDLPHAYQAYLFATININQRKVDKSLAYEQFGYNLDEEDKSGWSPDKLAVFLTRRLNLDPKSPLNGHIKIAPIHDEEVVPASEGQWKVSTAAIVEGISKLISASPMRDRDFLHQQPAIMRSRDSLDEDSAPLRNAYLSGKDEDIYNLLAAYFEGAESHLWSKANSRSFIIKTIGIQALFDILRFIAQEHPMAEIPEKTDKWFEVASPVDFSDGVFQASNKGRVLVRNTILLLAGQIQVEELSDQQLYGELLTRYARG